MEVEGEGGVGGTAALVLDLVLSPGSKCLPQDLGAGLGP